VPSLHTHTRTHRIQTPTHKIRPQHQPQHTHQRRHVRWVYFQCHLIIPLRVTQHSIPLLLTPSTAYTTLPSCSPSSSPFPSSIPFCFFRYTCTTIMAPPANFPATTSAGGFCVCAKRGLCTSEEIKTRETKVHQKRPVYNKRGLRRQTDRLKQLRLYVGRGLSTSEDQKKDQRCIVFDSCPSFTDLLWHNVYVKKPAATSAGGFCVCV